jgi:oxygen-dependent protoporphyrinogen oxidase
MVEMEREHGSLIRAMFARRKQGKGPGRLLSFEGGLATLIDRLTADLGDCVRTNTAARTLQKRAAGWRVVTMSGETIDADHIVLATSARVASGLLRDVDAALAGRLHEIPFSGVSVVALAYPLRDIPRTLDGYGYLVTRPEGLATLGVVWESSLFPARAPEGMGLLRIVLGGARRPDLAGMATDAVVAIARDELRHVMKITADPAHAWAFRWPGAIAQYTVGHAERMKAIRESLAAHDGLDVVGTSYDGVSFNHAIAAGRALGRSLAVRCASTDHMRLQRLNVH